MSFANHESVWQFSTNLEAFGSTALAICRMQLWSIKNALVSFASNPWTVVGSSDATTAGMDGVDRWVTSANLNWNTTNRSWIVLKQSKIDTNFQVLFSCAASGSSEIVIQISSSAGFTGGAINSNPTATDVQTLQSASEWGGVTTSPGNYPLDGAVMHVMQTEDGYQTRVLGFRNINTPGMLTTYMAFERAKNPISEWTNPYFSTSAGVAVAPTVASFSSQHGFYTNFTNASGPANANELVARHSGTAIQLVATVEGAASNLLLNTLPSKNDISGKYNVYPCGLFCIQSQYRGRVAEIADFYMAHVNNHLYYYPDTDGNEKKWFQVGNIIVPWNGSIATIG